MARILAFVIVVLVVTLALSFAVLNARPVPLDFYFGTREIPLALALVLALVGGAVLGVAASLAMVLRARGEARRLRRSARRAEEELENLRKLPLRPEP